MERAEDGLVRYDAGGASYLGFRKPVSLRNGDMLSLIITIPERELLAAARSALRENLLLAAVVFIAALAATPLAAWSISRSPAHLKLAANRLRDRKAGVRGKSGTGSVK